MPTISDLENAIKAKDSKIAEQNDSLSYFTDSTIRLMTEINQLNQMMESQSLQFEHTIKDKDSEISDLNEMLNNFRKLQAPPPPRGTTCAICLEAPQTHVFIPCGHVCACQQCSKRVRHSAINVQRRQLRYALAKHKKRSLWSWLVVY